MEQVFFGNVKPWQPVGEPLVHAKGYGLRIMRQRYKQPDGTENDYDYLAGRTGVTIFAVTDKRDVVLVEEFKQGVGMLCLGSPAGTVEEGESILETAGRELVDESGFKARRLILLPGKFFFGERKFPFGYQIVLAINCIQVGVPTPDGGEVAFNVHLSTSREFWHAVAEGKIRACQTIHAAYAAAMMGYIEPPD